MAYKLNGKAYTNHALMDEVIYNIKIILNGIILKNTRLADEYEDEDMMLQADYLLAIDNGSMALNFFPFTEDMLLAYGYDHIQATDIMVDWTLIPKEDRVELLQFCNKWFMDHYVEKNPYYRHLNGLPEYGTDEYNIYIDPNNPKLIDDDANTNFNFSVPLHEYSTKEINTLEALGIMKDIKAQYTGFHYSYLSNLGSRRIDPIKARVAEQWDILYMPEVEFLVKSRFKQVYAINKDIYMRHTYQEAYIYMSDYYDEMVMLMILCQTMTDLITELPEWYIRRDIFDLRSVKYFLDSNGVAFFKEIPLKFQVKIVKNLNRLIKYKSTTKNVLDILEIFRQEGTTVYKYYLFKKFLYNKNIKTDPDHPPLPEKFYMEDYSWDFGDEDEDEIVYDAEDGYLWDMGCEETDEIVRTGELRWIDFGDEDDNSLMTGEETDKEADGKERDRTIHDENGNVYQLEFVRTPIDGCYDDYIKDEIYRESYDTVTLQDEYWDGEDIHYLVRNNHLKKDFTIEGTKYMFLDYSISASDYFYQVSYFLGLLFNSNIDTDDITVSVPSINTEVDFSLIDLCVFLVCLSAKFNNLSLDVKMPVNLKDEHVHPFYKYIYANGGMFYDGPEDTPPEPEPEEPEGWMDSYYDFGDEEADDIKYDPLYGTMYDMGNHFDIDPDKDLLVYDFGEITETSVESQTPPKKDPWYVSWAENGGALTVVGSDQAIKDYLSHTKFIAPEDWTLGNWYDFGKEGKGGTFDFGDESVDIVEVAAIHYDGTDLDSDPLTEEEAATFNFGDEDEDTVEVQDEYLQTLNAAHNCVGDNYNYDFYDESDNVDFMPVYHKYHRMYDFNLGDPDYDPVPPPPVNVPYPWWEEGVEFHPYEMELDGRHPNPNHDKLGTNHNWANGGKGVRYTQVTHDTFYNWMNTNNPQLFIPTTGRIYGFNVTVNIEEIKKNIAVRHSDFEFLHGYTLEDFGLENYDTTKKISSIEDLIKIYRTNTECYKNLEQHLENNRDTRDKMVIMTYLFNSLFTVPLDKSFYRLKDGQIASSYDEILKERNLILYKYYKELMNEPDPEARKDMTRDILNQIVSILEYYTSADDMKYVWSWIPTNSFQAITEYIQLMINFFKSWKVYFLDPHVTYRLDDKKENMVGFGDQIVETRIGQWISDNYSITDSISIDVHRFIEENGGIKKEVVDIMAYHQPDVTRENNFIDGRYPLLTDKEKDEMGVANGGQADRLLAIPYIKADGGNVAARFDVYHLDGAGTIDMQEYLTLDGGNVFNFCDMKFPMHQNWEDDFSIADGGNVEDSLSSSTSISSYIKEITWEDFSFRMASHYDFGDEEHDDVVLDETKGKLYDLGDEITIDPKHEIRTYDFGEITETSIENPTSPGYKPENDENNGLMIGEYYLIHDVIVSTRKKNDIRVLWDGIYLGAIFVTQQELDDLKNEMVTSQTDYINIMTEMKNKLSDIPSFDNIESSIEAHFSDLFENPELVLKDKEDHQELETANGYTDQRINDLIQWFNDMVPFDDWEFKPEKEA